MNDYIWKAPGAYGMVPTADEVCASLIIALSLVFLMVYSVQVIWTGRRR